MSTPSQMSDLGRGDFQSNGSLCVSPAYSATCRVEPFQLAIISQTLRSVASVWLISIKNGSENVVVVVVVVLLGPPGDGQIGKYANSFI